MATLHSVVFLNPKTLESTLRRFGLAVLVSLFACAGAVGVIAGPEISISEDDTTVTIHDAPQQEVFVLGRSVIVSKRAKGILAIGGDVTIEGHVEGDVATIGGNIIQKKDAYVGGDVIVVGGSYQPEADAPLREEGRETVILAVFEDELRAFGQKPSSVLTPEFTPSFFVQRLLLMLVWFVVTMIATTLAPGAVSRAITRVNLSPLKIAAIGAAVFLACIMATVTGALALPNFVGATVGLVSFLILTFGYVFGRVTLQIATGKLIQKYVFGDARRSETGAILIGVVFWAILLAVPYFWVASLFAVFIFGIGLLLTGRTQTSWKMP